MQIVGVCKNLCFSRYVCFAQQLCSCAKSKRTSSPKPTSSHFFFWGLLTMLWIWFVFPFLLHTVTRSFSVLLIIATLHPNFTLRTVCLLSLPFNLLFFFILVFYTCKTAIKQSFAWLKKKKEKRWAWSCILKSFVVVHVVCGSCLFSQQCSTETVFDRSIFVFPLFMFFYTKNLKLGQFWQIQLWKCNNGNTGENGPWRKEICIAEKGKVFFLNE